MKQLKDYKKDVTVIKVAQELGYVLDRRQGIKFPNFVKYDGMGKKIDSIIITHKDHPEQMGYFRHIGGKGDVITFIQENLNALSRYGKTVREVLAALSGEPSGEVELDFHSNRNENSQPFDLSKFAIETLENRMYLMRSMFESRHISIETAEKFSKNLLRVCYAQTSRKDPSRTWIARDLGFPYRIPGDSRMVGLELRNMIGLKRKVAGSNSTDAVWSLDFSDNNPQNVKRVFFAESPFDLMAMYQLHKNKINKFIGVEETAYVATGGAFSNNQILNAMAYYPNAKAVDCFDNDLAGNLYGIRMMMLLEDRELAAVRYGNEMKFTVDRGKISFSLPNEEVSVANFRKHVRLNRGITVFKAPEGFKDWNDVLMDKRMGEPKEVESLKSHLNSLMLERKSNEQDFKKRR